MPLTIVGAIRDKKRGVYARHTVKIDGDTATGIPGSLSLNKKRMSDAVQPITHSI